MKKEERMIKMMVYIANDGKEFKSESECKSYEKLLKKIKYFTVRYNPELNETGVFQNFLNLVVICGYPVHEEIVRSFIRERLGIEKEFCKGIMGVGYSKTFSIKENSDADLDDCNGILFGDEVQPDVNRFIEKKFRYYYNYSSNCNQLEKIHGDVSIYLKASYESCKSGREFYNNTLLPRYLEAEKNESSLLVYLPSQEVLLYDLNQMMDFLKNSFGELFRIIKHSKDRIKVIISKEERESDVRVKRIIEEELWNVEESWNSLGEEICQKKS